MATTPINLTPHKVVVYESTDPNSAVLHEFPSEGNCRLIGSEFQTNHAYSRELQLPVITPPRYTGVTGLPEDYKRCIIVSMMCAEFLRTDEHHWHGHMLVPATDPAHVVRDATGAIVGVTAFHLY